MFKVTESLFLSILNDYQVIISYDCFLLIEIKVIYYKIIMKNIDLYIKIEV